MKLSQILFASMILSTAACSGMRKSEGTFTTHAESFRIVGFAIPGDDQAAAYKLVPEGGAGERGGHLAG